jgi:hypothetical protein
LNDGEPKPILLHGKPQAERGQGDMARAQASATPPIRAFTAVIGPDEEDSGYIVTFPEVPKLAT